MKNLGVIIGVLIVLVIAGGVYHFSQEPQQEVLKLGSRSIAIDTLNGYGVATTVPDFITGATSTYIVDIAGAESLDMNFQFNASSTASKLVWTYEFSYDGIDYFVEDIVTVSGSIFTHNATAVETAYTYHYWTPGIAGVSRKNMTIDNLGAEYMRVKVNTWAGNGSFWGQAILNKSNF